MKCEACALDDALNQSYGVLDGALVLCLECATWAQKTYAMKGSARASVMYGLELWKARGGPKS